MPKLKKWCTLVSLDATSRYKAQVCLVKLGLPFSKIGPTLFPKWAYRFFKLGLPFFSRWSTHFDD